MSSTKIAPGSTILVTGAGGFIGSAVVNQLLIQGFKVRATTRTVSKLDQLKEKSEKEFGSGALEVVEVKDLSVKGALDGALDGIAGVVNVASDTSLTPNLKDVVESVVSMTENILNSVKAAGGVKSFVLTSSRVAAFHPDGKSKIYADRDWQNEAATVAEQVQDPLLKGVMVYSASKVAGEKAVWEWTKEEKPGFRVNTVLPDVTFGKIHNPAPGNYTTGSGVRDFADGKSGLLDFFFAYPCWFVDVDDVAKLHVAALLDETVDQQRIWGATSPFSAADFQEILKEVKPDYEERDVSAFAPRVDITIVNDASIKLLKKHYGSGFTDLKTSIKANIS